MADPSLGADARSRLIRADIRLGIGLVGWVFGAFVSAVFAVVLAGILGYDLFTPTGVGSDIGRVAGQFHQDLPFENPAIPIQWTFAFNVPQWIALIGVPMFLASLAGATIAGAFGFRVRLADLNSLLLGVVMQVVVLYLLYLVYFEVFGEADVGEPARRLAATANGWGVVAFVVMVVVVAPIAEELFFRGLVFGALRELVPDWVAVGVSAAIFAAVHFQLVQFIGLFVLGVVLAVQTQRSDRLGPAIMTHAGFNAVTALSLVLL
ncbi:MAG: CPBP family intramembrane metalloprotease [Acidimicrobiales bacterium]|nr:CPBP family intramembrane metalloprotease [Acidimicrobiales bacterium]